MNIGIAIVAHVSRTEMAEELSAKTGGEIFWDDGSLGEWENHKQALAWLLNFEHGIILQDDAGVSETFVEDAEKAIAARPGDIISFYTGTGLPKGIQKSIQIAVARAERENLSWLTSKRIWWGVALAIPNQFIRPIVMSYSGLPYDQHIGNWCSKYSVKSSYTYPSLVEHLDPPSLVGPQAAMEPRVAHTVGRQKNPRDRRVATFGL